MNSKNSFLHDLGQELALLAERIEGESEASADQFQRGRRFGVYEVLSIMKQQAEAFGLSEAQIGLEGIDIEKLLK